MSLTVNLVCQTRPFSGRWL